MWSIKVGEYEIEETRSGARLYKHGLKLGNYDKPSKK
jgi:hypothetical protein